jgi:hypothetical protein
VVLNEAAESSFGRTKGSIQGMYIGLSSIDLLLLSISYLQLPRLVVCTVGERHQFFVFSLERKPGLKIVFLGRSVVESTRDNCDDTIRKFQGFVKFLCYRGHVFESLPRIFRFGDEKLFDLLELVDSKDPPGIFPMGAGFFAVAGTVTSVSFVKVNGVLTMNRRKADDKLT